MVSILELADAFSTSDISLNLPYITLLLDRPGPWLQVLQSRLWSLYSHPPVQSLREIRLSLDFREKLWYRLVFEERGDTMKILEELWFGNINPQGPDAQKDPRMERALYLVVKNEDTMRAMLSDTQKEQFEKVSDR